jgi:Ala-tRNA(Pro) deacylase
MSHNRLQKMLDDQHIKHEWIKHSPAFTAQEIAQTTHIPGKDLAKTVIVKMNDGKLAMIVLSANDKINFKHLLKSLGNNKIELASEREFKGQFPDCEVGAMPPFGNLWNMEVYVDEKLTHDKDIAFNAGSHTELLRMKYQDFEKLVHPHIIDAA